MGIGGLRSEGPFSPGRGQRARLALYSAWGRLADEEMGPNWIVHLARVPSIRPRSSHSCRLSSFIWPTVMRGLLGPGHGHAAMPTASQPRKAPPCAAPLGEAWYLEGISESATDDAVGVHGTAWCV